MVIVWMLNYSFLMRFSGCHGVSFPLLTNLFLWPFCFQNLLFIITLTIIQQVGLCDQIFYPGASKLGSVLTELMEVLAVPWEALDIQTKRIFSCWEGAWWHLSFVTDISHSRNLTIIQEKTCGKYVYKERRREAQNFLHIILRCVSELQEKLILSEL